VAESGKGADVGKSVFDERSSMKPNQGPEPSPAMRLLEIVVGSIVICGIMIIIVGWSAMDLIKAYEAGMARFPKGSYVLIGERPFLFWSIIASKLFMILLGIVGAAYALSVFFLRKPPVRW
jgi:hypothetical protein